MPSPASNNPSAQLWGPALWLSLFRCDPFFRVPSTGPQKWRTDSILPYPSCFATLMSTKARSDRSDPATKGPLLSCEVPVLGNLGIAPEIPCCDSRVARNNCGACHEGWVVRAAPRSGFDPGISMPWSVCLLRRRFAALSTTH